MAFAITETIIDVVSLSEEELDVLIDWLENIPAITVGLRRNGSSTTVIVAPEDQDDINWAHWGNVNAQIRQRLA